MSSLLIFYINLKKSFFTRSKSLKTQNMIPFKLRRYVLRVNQ